MGESSDEFLHLVDYPQNTIAALEMSYQVLSIVGNKVREALSSKPSLQCPTPSLCNSNAEKRRLHNNGGPVCTIHTDIRSTSGVDDLPQYTLDEISFHDSPYDCWVTIYDRVYDITSFLHEHPGGDEIIMEYAGRDATIAFRSVGHSKMTEDSLKQYRVGILVEEERIWTRFYNLSSDTPSRV